MKSAEVIVDGVRYVPETEFADRVTVYGMYECHLFHRIEGRSVDEIIKKWLKHNRHKQPAIVGGDKWDDLGPSMLCPATVFQGDKELRRVGTLVFPDGGERGRPESLESLEKYRTALKDDPDIERLLGEKR
jgi:hypothetical protein